MPANAFGVAGLQGKGRTAKNCLFGLKWQDEVRLGGGLAGRDSRPASPGGGSPYLIRSSASLIQRLSGNCWDSAVSVARAESGWPAAT